MAHLPLIGFSDFAMDRGGLGNLCRHSAASLPDGGSGAVQREGPRRCEPHETPSPPQGEREPWGD